MGIKKLSILLLGFLIFNNARGQANLGNTKFEIPPEYGFLIRMGDQVKDFTMTLTNGKTISSREWKGKVVMLQFTATWSGVCRKATPFIENQIWSKHKKNPLFELYAIDRGEPLETVKKYVKEGRFTYPHAIDPDAGIFSLFAQKKAGVTRNVIIDKDGKISYVTRLYNEDEFKKMALMIDNLLNKPLEHVN